MAADAKYGEKYFSAVSNNMRAKRLRALSLIGGTKVVIKHFLFLQGGSGLSLAMSSGGYSRNSAELVGAYGRAPAAL